MFAAGNNAKEAMLALMDAGGQQALSLQDNRGNNVLKYALDDSEVKVLLEKRCEESIGTPSRLLPIKRGFTILIIQQY